MTKVSTLPKDKVASFLGAMAKQLAPPPPPVQDPIEKAANFLDMLAQRWADEKEFEDFADYQKAMAKNLPEGSTDVKMTKRPFEVRYTDKEGVRRFIRIQRNRVVWGQIVKK